MRTFPEPVKHPVFSGSEGFVVQKESIFWACRHFTGKAHAFSTFDEAMDFVGWNPEYDKIEYTLVQGVPVRIKDVVIAHAKEVSRNFLINNWNRRILVIGYVPGLPYVDSIDSAITWLKENL